MSRGSPNRRWGFGDATLHPYILQGMSQNVYRRLFNRWSELSKVRRHTA